MSYESGSPLLCIAQSLKTSMISEEGSVDEGQV